MRWIDKTLEKVIVGDEVVKEFFAFFPVRAMNSDGKWEYRWMERVKVEYCIYEEDEGLSQILGKTIQKRASVLKPMKFLN